MRGGTSKGLFINPADLPFALADADPYLLRMMGSPDPHGRQLDGLGGATSSTSKVCFVSRSDRSDADVDFLFAHVGITSPEVDYSGNCGNLSAAVGIYAIETGLVAPCSPVTVVRVWQQNLSRHLLVHIPVDDEGAVQSEGQEVIAGVPGTGARIDVDFLLPGFDNDGHVLPTGCATDNITLPDGRTFVASLIHAGNATVFIRAADLKLLGTETPAEIESDRQLMALMESLRCEGGVLMGMGNDPAVLHANQPATPKIALVGAPLGYLSTGGEAVSQGQVDVVARILSMGLAHHTFTGTGAIATAVAACIPGTLVADVAGPVDTLHNSRQDSERDLRIGHPAGVLTASAAVDTDNLVARFARLRRTGRTLMRGEVLVPQR